MVSVRRTMLICAVYRLLKKLRKRRYGVHPINRSHKHHGQFHTQFAKLKADPARFQRHLRMDEARFDKLLVMFGPRLEKRSRREPIGPAERLFITLRFLGTGNSFASLSSTFHVGESTVGRIVDFKMVRYSDHYRRAVIRAIHVRARVIWDPTEPNFRSIGARKCAFDGVADRLGLMRTLRDALYGNAAAEDLHRMWRQWVRSFHAYKLRRTARKPKFFAELSFLNELSMDELHLVASLF